MTKEQIGKEIKELIRSIKTHYTFVEEEDRIPLIELELITSKIRKLYEKSIINNFLHSNDESFMSKERLNRFGERRSIEKNKPETSVKKVVVESASFPAPTIEMPIVNVSIQNSTPEFIPEIKEVEPANPQVNETVAEKKLKDLKLLIGINDKFLLINNLFARNDADYKTTIEQLSSLRDYSDAQNYMNNLAHQYAWNVESYAYVRFLQIIEKRYK